MATRGNFITFEGGEGSGKSTQLIRLANWLEERGISLITTREPGGSLSAETIRKLLVEGDTNRWQPITEALLHYAARTEHIAHVINPELESGRWVLSDRYSDSTIAYQAYGHGLDTGIIRSIHNASTEGLMPDLTLILDVPVEVGLERAYGRIHAEDRYERMGEGFHERVRTGFLEIAQQEPNRCIVLDATLGLDIVASNVIHCVTERLKLIKTDQSLE